MSEAPLRLIVVVGLHVDLQGNVLVPRTTGRGKTTTFYGALNEI